MLAMNTDTRSGHRGTARAFAAAVTGAGGLIAVRFAVPAGTPRIRPGGRAGSARGIAVLEKVRIGGSDQWVLERSEDVRNPVLLYLHGGPGTSQLTSNRRNTRHLEKFFTVVNWDQRGAGKSYRAISDAGRMNIGQFVADTRELTLYLLEKFGQERLVLVGHSWGTVIGALTVSAYRSSTRAMSGSARWPTWPREKRRLTSGLSARPGSTRTGGSPRPW